MTDNLQIDYVPLESPGQNSNIPSQQKDPDLLTQNQEGEAPFVTEGFHKFTDTQQGLEVDQKQETSTSGLPEVVSVSEPTLTELTEPLLPENKDAS